MWGPVHGSELGVSVRGVELGEKRDGAKWEDIRLEERRELVVKGEATFAPGRHGVPERRRETRG